MNDTIQNSVAATAEGITNYGLMTVTCAFFLVLAACLMVACFSWFKKMINQMMQNNTDSMAELLKVTQAQNEMLAEVSEGLRVETLLRIETIASCYFDLAIERVCRLVRNVKKENNIADREATKTKIRDRLTNIYEDRNNDWKNFSYRGHKLNYFTTEEWIDWVAEIVEKEVYNEKEDNGRIYSNIHAVYERIKLDFYKKLSR